MAISALIPAVRMLATKVASNPAVQEFGKDVLKNAAGIAVDAAATRLTRGFAPPEGLARCTTPQQAAIPGQQKDASQRRRSNATSALATLKAARQGAVLSEERAPEQSTTQQVAASLGQQTSLEETASRDF